MGNHMSHSSLGASGKVILQDGSIQEFEEPITVAELMLEHPQQAVVELKPSSAPQKRPTPLPADKTLEPSKFYLMIPLRRGKPAHLSPQEAHHILLRANALLRSKPLISSKFLPLFTKICPATSIIEDNNNNSSTQYGSHYSRALRGQDVHNLTSNSKCSRDCFQSSIEDNHCKKLEVAKKEKEIEEFDEVEDKPDYLSRQVSGKGWKPSLDTIVEKKDEVKKVGNWVMVAGKLVKRIESKGLVWG